MKILNTLLNVTLTIAFASSCGVEADKQTGRKLQVGSYPKDSNPFFLNPGKYERTFSGSIIAWQDNTNSDGMAEVARVSDSIIANGVASLKYSRDNVLPLKQEFDKLYGEAKATTIAYQTESYSAAATAAATWFGGETGAGGELLKIATRLKKETGIDMLPQDFQQAGTMFAAYCEAKIWERAVKGILVGETYRGRRPTPSAMCEGVYKKLGLLRTESKLCAGGETYRNYFGCLWHEGVVKTSLWRSRYPDDGDVASHFRNFSDEMIMHNIANEGLERALLQQKRAIDLLNPKTGAETKVNFKFTVGPKGPASLSVSKLISNVEVRAQKGDEFRFLPVRDRQGVAKDILEQEEARLRSQISFFSKLSNGNYVNENRFNRIFQQPTTTAYGDIAWSDSKKAEAAAMFPQVFLISSPKLDQMQASLGALQKQIKQNGLKGAQALQPLAPQPECPKLPDDHNMENPLDGSYTCVYSQLAIRGTEVVAPKNVTQAVWQGQLTFRRPENGDILEVLVLPNKVGGRTHYGCTTLNPEGDTKCPKAEDVDPAYGRASITIEEDTGYFEILAHIDDVKASGLEMRPRSNIMRDLIFNEISPDRLHGHDLYFYAALNDIGEVLSIFLGDAAIKDRSGETIIPGSLKMRDANPFYKVAADEYGKALKALQ